VKVSSKVEKRSKVLDSSPLLGYIKEERERNRERERKRGK